MFEVNIRFVGGLLSAYYLSGKEVRNILKVLVVFSRGTSAVKETSKRDLAAFLLIDVTDGTKQMMDGGG